MHSRLLPNRGKPPLAPSGASAPASQVSIAPQQHHQPCYDPLPWDTHFHRREFVDLSGDGSRFRYYIREPPPAEGHQSSANQTQPPTPPPPLIFFLHGGGFCGLSWSALCDSLASKASCRCVAMDSRGHGDTEAGGDDLDLELDRMADDAAALIQLMTSSNPSPVVLVGHSMGGAVATHLTSRSNSHHQLSIAALVVIDVVEGSAMEALSGMRTYLASRPTNFPNLQTAIRWCHRSGTVRNLDSARISFPGHLRLVSSGTASAAASASTSKEDQSDRPKPPTLAATTMIKEEEDEEGDGEAATNAVSPAERQPQQQNQQQQQKQRQQQNQQKYTWRIDLGRTEPHWAGWFAGMSRKFLEAPAAKLLLLAGVDRLDRELTVGQMQGKFQMQVLPRSGHAVHEDHPEHVAEVLAGFLVRHKLAKPLSEFHPVPPGC